MDNQVPNFCQSGVDKAMQFMGCLQNTSMLRPRPSSAKRKCRNPLPRRTAQIFSGVPHGHPVPHAVRCDLGCMVPSRVGGAEAIQHPWRTRIDLRTRADREPKRNPQNNERDRTQPDRDKTPFSLTGKIRLDCRDRTKKVYSESYAILH